MNALSDATLRRLREAAAAPDLSDTKYSFDGMHLTREGNAIIAQALVEPLLALARDRSK